MEKHDSQRAAAASLNMPISTFRGRLRKAGKLLGSTSQVKKQESEGSTTVTASGSSIRTVEELLEAAQIDLDEWEILESTVNAWGNEDSQSFQVKVRLKRKVPIAVTEAVDGLLESLKKVSPKRSAPKRRDPGGVLLVFGVQDVHISKLCWAPETGWDNYDLDIAKQVYQNAVEDILGAVSHYEIDQATLIIGSDLFHSDDDRNRTYNGTPLDCDGRHAKVFTEVCQLLTETIDRIRCICPVYCPLVPGNHDQQVSYYAAQVLASRFHNDEWVDIDTTPTLRKYQRWGCNLIGYTHGHEIKLDNLPLIMATESPEDWAQTTSRDWQIGHFHRAKEVRYLAMDEQTGVRLRVNSSLCPPDRWHADRGFIGNRRAAEGYVYSHCDGYVSTVSVNARTQ